MSDGDLFIAEIPPYFSVLSRSLQKSAFPPLFRQIYPMVINFRLAIHKFDSMNIITILAVFLASPR